MINYDDYLENMDKRHKAVYKILIENIKKNSLSINYKPTPWKGNDSKNSLTFDFNGLSIVDGLKRTFKITNIDFDYLFDQACSGSGKEEKRITVLRSSSLCALLFFHNVSKNNPVKIDGCLFDKVFFEVQNTVISSRNPSNIDVVLVSSKSKKILYLESKFAEYYLNNGCVDISIEYLEKDTLGEQIYTKDNIEDTIGLILNKNLNKEGLFRIDSDSKKTKSKCKSYCKGIKQMISHYIGLSNFVKETNLDRDSRNIELKKLFDSGYSIYLGEILFDFDNDDIKPFREDYKQKYEKFAKLINDKFKKIQIRCLEKTLNYSDLKEFVNPTIKKFYFGE